MKDKEDNVRVIRVLTFLLRQAFLVHVQHMFQYNWQPGTHLSSVILPCDA